MPNVASIRTFAHTVVQILQAEVNVAATSFFVVDNEDEKIWRAGSSTGAPPARPESPLGDREDVQRYALEQGVVGNFEGGARHRTFGDLLWGYFSRAYPENMARHYPDGAE